MSHHEIEKKFQASIKTLRPNTEYVIVDKAPETQEEFNENIKWVTGKTETNTAITTTTNPHSEITWTLVKAEMDRLQTEYDAQEYARKREAEYPSVQDLVVALYDTDDKTAIDEKRAEIKLKYPKPGA
jgi:hypothetical protein